MTASELINYIDMQDIYSETFEIYEVTHFGYVTPFTMLVGVPIVR